MWAFFVAAFVTVIISVMVDRFAGVIGLCGFSLLVTAIVVYTKYVAVEFFYDLLCEGYDEPLLVVRQTVGRRSVTLCRIELSAIESITKESREERKAKSRDPQNKALRYTYMPTLDPQSSCRLVIKRDGMESHIMLEFTDEMLALFSSYVEEAKKLYPVSDDGE